MNQDAVAKAIHRSAGMLSMYENGQKDVPAEVLQTLIKALKVSPEEVRFWDEEIEEIIKEGRIDYQPKNMIPVELLPPEMLEQLAQFLSREAFRYQGSERMRYQEASIVITREQNRRGIS